VAITKNMLIIKQKSLQQLSEVMMYIEVEILEHARLDCFTVAAHVCINVSHAYYKITIIPSITRITHTAFHKTFSEFKS